MKSNTLLSIFVFVGLLNLGMNAASEESKVEKIETQKNKVMDSAKSTYRAAQDKGCEMMNGKLECTGKKMKNKLKDYSDKVQTKATEEKNKID